MKNLFLILFIVISYSTLAQKSYQANTDNSSIKWKGFKPTGSHHGIINLKNGYFTIENSKIVGGEFTIDMNSIIDLDLSADDKYNTQLVNHLKSVNFFEVSTYPTAKFKIISSENKGVKTLIKGELTLKDKTNSVEFLATIKINKNDLEFHSDSFKIDRSKWNVKYKSKSFFNNLKDKFIYDDMEITVEITATK